MHNQLQVQFICIDAGNIKKQPIIIYTNEIGSRSDITKFYIQEEITTVSCGCFYGDLEEFEKAVEETHGDNKHGKVYKKWIEKVRLIEEVR